MPEAVELVIFDCDGVLVDSEPIAVRVDLVVLAEFGLELSEAEVIERFVGRSPAVMLEAIEAHLGRRLPDRLESYEHLSLQ
jgi:beta-phosphoglucomutase-like phosphatase (HAD superfamily)